MRLDRAEGLDVATIITAGFVTGYVADMVDHAAQIGLGISTEQMRRLAMFAAVSVWHAGRA
jgi:hypothetical protein